VNATTRNLGAAQELEQRLRIIGGDRADFEHAHEVTDAKSSDLTHLR
jgi:hypothetical protein